MYPEISVVIPAYNAERFIAPAISSALSQTIPPCEIIVVDDGSTDGTKEAVSRFDRDVKYIFQENAGPSVARNTGVREARGEWVAFLDSDDYWDDSHLQQLMEAAGTDSEPVLVYCGKKFVDVDGNVMADGYKQTRFPSGWIFADLLTANYISSASVVIMKRKTFIDSGGFNPQMRNSEDYELWLRVASVAPMTGVPVYTVNYRRHDSNLTLQTLNHIKGHMRAFKHACALITERKVDRRNLSPGFDILEVQKRYYNDVATELFYLNEFREMQLLGFDALKDRCVTAPLLFRWTLSFLPENMILSLKKARRLIKVNK